MEEDKKHDGDGRDSRHNRIMSQLKDSVLSHIATLNPSLSPNSNHASFIHRRLRELFTSFHTPTHPPYALMIHKAIMELNEETGSTVEAISAFIRREYKDLPWAHVRILGLHLTKLCEGGELVCTNGGRYMLLVNDDYGDARMGRADGEETECRGSKKRKRDKKKSDNGEGEGKGTLEIVEGVERGNELQEQEPDGTNEPSRVAEREYEWTRERGEAHQQSIEWVEEEQVVESEKGLLGVVEKQSQSEWQGTGVIEEYTEAKNYQGRMAQAQTELEEPQVQMLQDDCISHFETIASSQSTALNPLVESQKPLPVRRQCFQPRGRLPNVQKANLIELKQQQQLQQRGQGRGLGRLPKLHRNSHQCKMQLQPQDQAQGLLSSPYSEPKEPIYSSQPTAPNFPVNISPNFGQQLMVPTSEGSPECIISTGIELSPTQLPLQISSDIDLGATSKMEASLSYVNVHEHKQPHHCNQGSPKGKLDENPLFGDPEQRPPKLPRRGRPPKLKTVVDYPGESLFPSDDGILNEQQPYINNVETQQQHRRGRGRGRPPKLNRNANQCDERLLPQYQVQHRGRGRGRGRPPKLNRNANQSEEQLQPNEQAQQHGRGQGRGRGRPPKLNQNTHQHEEQLQTQDPAQGLVSSPNPDGDDSQSFEYKQLQLQIQAQSQGRCPNLESEVDESCQKQQFLPQVRRGRGRPPKTNTYVRQSQWQQLQTCQGQDQRLERPRNPLSDARQSHQQQQPQPWEVQGRGRGRRPPKQKLQQKQSYRQLQLRVYHGRAT